MARPWWLGFYIWFLGIYVTLMVVANVTIYLWPNRPGGPHRTITGKPRRQL